MALSRTVSSSPDNEPIHLEYEPGTCNIGPAEITRRRRTGHVGVLASFGLLASLLALDAPAVARGLIALPATAAAVGYLQAHFRFCAAFGFRGVFNFGAIGEQQAVGGRARMAVDRRRAASITVAGVGIGIAAGILAILLPA